MSQVLYCRRKIDVENCKYRQLTVRLLKPLFAFNKYSEKLIKNVLKSI